jgi:prepilin-type N-terminal cleavage/methylation domain
MIRENKGVTLIELMIVITIIGIVSAIALPSYQSHLVKTRRALATACLIDVTQVLERTFAASTTFEIDLDGDGSSEGTSESLDGYCDAEVQKFYSFSVNQLNQSQYELRATPKASQYDPQCEALSINQAGELKVIGGSSSVNSCWR